MCRVMAGLATLAGLLASASLPGVAMSQLRSTRDSAGIRIVENESRKNAPVVFRLGDRPVLDVGGTEDNPDLEFDHNQGYLRGVRLSDGRLVVIDDSRIHFFGADGKRQKIVGRRGAGPEEFNYLSSICRTRGDTIVVGDQRNRRLAIVDPQGAINRTIAFGDFGYPPFEACFEDGTIVLEREVGEFVPGGARPDRLTRLRTDGSVASVFPDLPGYVLDMITGGEMTVLPAGRHLYYGDGATSEVKVFNSDGKLERIIRTDDPPIPISDAEAEERMARTIPRNVAGAERTARMDRMRSMRRAKSWPAYGRMHVDTDGRLWVQDYTIMRPSPVGWTAFDSTGRMIGRLMLPAPREGERALQVIGFGRNDILVRRYDADRATYLTVYRIVAAGGRND